MRCLALAEEFSSRGCEVVFLCKAGSEQAAPALRRAPYGVVAIDDDPSSVGAALQNLGQQVAGACIIDSYQVGPEHERKIRAFSRVLVVIDDFTNRPHDCDLLIAPTIGRKPVEFTGVAMEHTEILAGSSFTLLRSEFRDMRPVAAQRRRTPSMKRILVTMGLTANDAIAIPVAEQLAEKFPSLAIDVVLGSPSSGSRSSLDRIKWTNVQFHVDPTSMAALMCAADVAVGAAGSTTWERCCLALPSVQVVMAENQRDIANGVAAAGAAITVNSLDPGKIVDAVVPLVENASLRERMARNAAQICDGMGAQRVATATLERIERAHPPG